MTYPQNWPQPSPHFPDAQTEHRLTRLEVVSEAHEEAHEEHYTTTDAHRERLNSLERAILFLVAVVAILAQDKFPALAALLKGGTP